MTTVVRKLLVANRGEIAIRIARTAADLGIATVGVHSSDDARSLHVRAVDEVVPLAGSGPAGYLDVDDVVRAAASTGCDAVHPGYGFLAEHAGFAWACESAGLTFVGPSPDALDLFGNKVRARELASSVGVPVLRAVPAEQAAGLLASLGAGGAVMVKAVAGGGGRGMRPVTSADDLDAALERCASEAQAAFGNGDVYVEELLPGARHVEVQVVGDGTSVSHLWDRECSLQQQRQKIVEVAPASMIDDAVRSSVLAAAVEVAASGGGGRAVHRRVPRRSVVGTLRVPRGEPSAPGRAHGDRGGAGSRPRGAAARAGGRRDVVLARARAGGRAGAAGRRRPVPGQPRWRRRHARRLRAAVGSGRAGRRLRLRRVPHEHAVRRAAGQGDRPRCRRRAPGRGGKGDACAGRVPDRRRCHQPRLAAVAARRSGGALR